MQTLWSRAAQKPSTCRCISCISNTTAVARRVGSTSIRRPWSFQTTSTFFYSAIFTTALVVDGKAKRKRNEQWDTAFTSAREELAKPFRQTVEDGGERVDTMISEEQQEDGTSILFTESHTTLDELCREDVDWESVHRAAGMELILDHQLQRLSEVPLEELSENLWKLLPFDSRMPGTQAIMWPASTGPVLARHHLPPQSLWSLDHIRWKALRKRQTWKKIALQELSVALLVRKLIPKFREGMTGFMTSLPETIQDVMLGGIEGDKRTRREIMRHIHRIELFNNDSAEGISYAKTYKRPLGVPRYYQDDDGDFYSTSEKMNKAIRNILFPGPNDRKQRDRAIAKVCHNLLVSSAPPDVQTFNLLITGLSRWKRAGPVDVVISTIDACKIRPNEITCTAIINHYIQHNRPEDFTTFVARMRGLRNALMLARPDIVINEAGADRLVPVDRGKIYQKVHPTPMVFNALMLGALKFAGLERALEIYFEMKEDGWGLDVVGLTAFLRDCMERRDWQNGFCVWDEICIFKDHVKNSRQLSRAYSTMLGLCTVTGNTRAFNHVLAEAVDRGLDKGKVTAMALEMQQEKTPWWLPQNNPPNNIADSVFVAISGYLGDSDSD
ncbi:hypothetical protein K469DRAFT_472161, partial [Zopfia rhizophila CBS 207.26]